jgi:hypothetical protein
MVEVCTHPLFWHDANQYLIIRDDNDHVHITRTKVQMDMAVANQVTGDEEGSGTPQYKFEPQQGKFLDVFIGPNQSLVVIGINTKGMLWKKEFYKGFFDIFTF